MRDGREHITFLDVKSRSTAPVSDLSQPDFFPDFSSESEVTRESDSFLPLQCTTVISEAFCHGIWSTQIRQTGDYPTPL